MNWPEVLPNVWTPFGFPAPYVRANYSGGSDATISSNTSMSGQVAVYRDLTINNGIVLTASSTPQILICRTLNFGNTSSQISADQKGGGYRVGFSGAGNGGGGALHGYDTSGTPATTASDFLSALFTEGGAGGGTTGGGNGSAFQDPVLFAGFTLNHFGLAGGGGGGAGGGGSSGTVGGTGGKRGGGGGAGAGTRGGGGGGSGVGGGGGGGCGPSSGSGTGGDSGGGGGVLLVVCDKIVGAAGLITANGGNGSNGSSGGGGGGGGGGLVVVWTRTLIVTPTLQVNGGNGGSGNGTGSGNGGIGGPGRSQLFRAM